MSRKTLELQEEVMASIEAALAEGIVPWRQSWLSDLPRNPITRRNYRGMNILTLWVRQLRNHYPRQEWASYNQWGSKGAHVRKGEKGTPITFFKMSEYPDKENPGEKYKIPTWRLSYVFNVAQVDGWPEVEARTPPPLEDRHERAAAIIRRHGIEFMSGEPAYFVQLDQLSMPALEKFESPCDYYRTGFHEMGHWTGHQSRLDRDSLLRRKSIVDKILEELTAELTSAFLSARLGLTQGKTDNAVTYITNWLSQVPQDAKPAMLMKAASQAGKACDFIDPEPAEEEPHDDR